MSKKQSNFTSEQQQAVATAVLDRLMSARAVSAAAMAGELGLPPFSISPSSVGNWAREELRRREGQQPDGLDRAAQARIDELTDRIIDQVERAVDELEDEEGPLDIGRAHQIVNLLRKIAKEPGSSARAGRVEGQASTLLTRLAQADSDNDGDDGNNGLAA